MARLSVDDRPLSGEPVVNTSPALTAPLGLASTGAVPLGTALGLAVVVPRGPGADWLGLVWVGTVWAVAALKLHRPAARRK